MRQLIFKIIFLTAFPLIVASGVELIFTGKLSEWHIIQGKATYTLLIMAIVMFLWKEDPKKQGGE